MRWFLLLCFLLPSTAKADDPKPRELLEALQKQLATASATAGPSIACIVVSRSEHYPKDPKAAKTPGKLGEFDSREFLKTNPTRERLLLAKSLDLSDSRTIPDHGFSGGVVVDSSGLILTPYHAISGATKIYVFLPGGVGSYADIHAADVRCDLAVLKLINPPAKLVPIQFADVRLRDADGKKASVYRGKLAILLANPYSPNFRLDAPSAAFGGITNVRYRLVNNTDKAATVAEKLASYYKCGTLLEHDVKVNADVTGGVLVDLDGKMIGLTTSAAVVYNRAIGPGYAMAADADFRRLVDVLKRGEEIEYGFLGVSIPRVDNAGPIRLVGLTGNGPAQEAGLRIGDIITQINGQPAKTFDDLMLYIGSALAGSTVKMHFTRFGEGHDVEVTLGKYSNDQPFIASVRPEPVFGLRVDYSSIRPFTLNTRFDTGRLSPGVLVREIVPDSPADKQFKALGDDPKRWFITRVNDTPVSTPAEFYRAAKGQKKVELTLIDPRDPSSRARELTLP